MEASVNELLFATWNLDIIQCLFLCFRLVNSVPAFFGDETAHERSRMLTWMHDTSCLIFVGRDSRDEYTGICIDRYDSSWVSCYGRCKQKGYVYRIIQRGKRSSHNTQGYWDSSIHRTKLFSPFPLWKMAPSCLYYVYYNTTYCVELRHEVGERRLQQ